MNPELLKEQVEKLKSTLGTIETQLSAQAVPREGLEDLKNAVDNVRRTVWALLSAAESTHDYEVLLARFRLNRALELCQQVAVDIGAGLIATDSSELRRFHTTLKDTLSRVERLISGKL